MAEPSTRALRAALSRSYGTSIDGGGRRRRLPLSEALRVLAADLRTPGDKRKRAPLPRIVLGLALWHLAEGYLDGRHAVDHATAAELDALFTEVYGWTLAELDAMRRRHLEPLRTIARQYKILDYRWTPPAPAGGAISASLELLVQAPVEQVCAVVEPAQWQRSCPLFWSDVVAEDGRRFADVGKTRKLRFAATLGLPERVGAPRAAVEVSCGISAARVGHTNEFTMRAAPAGGRGLVAFCRGTIRTEKEVGKPWMTRIRHTKRLDVGAAALPDEASDALSYWMQAESACVVTACLC